MEPNEQHVSTEAQRMALEAMSAQLVHKLNAMIREQEERARAFAEQHHSTLSIPQNQQLPVVEPVRNTPPPAPAPVKPQPVPQHRLDWDTPVPAEKPLQSGPRKTTTPEEGSNIGLAMIIFSMLGIMMLLRACT